MGNVSQLRNVGVPIMWQGAYQLTEPRGRRGGGVQVQIHSRSVVYVDGKSAVFSLQSIISF